jgi:hypothetical protein
MFDPPTERPEPRLPDPYEQADRDETAAATIRMVLSAVLFLVVGIVIIWAVTR